jgi:hypothetical protein
MVGYDLISWITKIKCGQIEREKCLFRYWQPEEVGGFRQGSRFHMQALGQTSRFTNACSSSMEGQQENTGHGF